MDEVDNLGIASRYEKKWIASRQAVTKETEGERYDPCLYSLKSSQ
jgi:hypothetical protein